MKYNHKKRGFILTSGKEVYANNGIIGINPDLLVHEGYDGWVQVEPNPVMDCEGLTKDEARELGEYMVSLWQAFLVKVESRE